MIRQIILHPDTRLRTKCEPVADITDERRQLAVDMLETMYAAPGIGLAASQLGVMERLIVMDCIKPDENKPEPTIMFNPQIISRSDETFSYEEGCLSFPEQFAEVCRPTEVEVSWINEDGNPVERSFDGLWAICVQHEVDHLDGKLFIDYLTPVRRQIITRKMKKMKRELDRD